MTTTQYESFADSLRRMYERQAEEATANALASIAEARRELDGIEAELRFAQAGQPFKNVGVVKGANAGTIFEAFGAYRSLAALAHHEARAERSRS
jgi:hypothetical protein